MPLLEWFSEIFPTPQEPYSMAEVVARLQQLYHPCVSESQCYRALAALKKSPATAAIVAPLDATKPAPYSAEAARRIARRVTRGLEPERLFPPASKNSATTSQVGRSQSANPPENRLAP